MKIYLFFKIFIWYDIHSNKINVNDNYNILLHIIHLLPTTTKYILSMLKNHFIFSYVLFPSIPTQHKKNII